MIEIDGSYGEGGGQILRTTTSLSALTLEPVRIVNIRAGRPNPGLKRQHMAGIELLAKIAKADVRGLEVGSTELEFIPTKIAGGVFEHDIGTAGAISLVLQAILPAAITAEEPITLRLRGGTDVSWSPPIDYIREVAIPVLNQLGVSVEIKQRRRGHYPRGGGMVEARIMPCKELSGIELVSFGNVRMIHGISHCVRLPSHVAERQAKGAEEILQSQGLNIEQLYREHYPRNKDPHLGPGSGIVLWAESDTGTRIGADALGAKGKRAEDVGAEAARKLLAELSTGKAIDSHLGDMLVPYLALANGSSRIGVTKITSHLTTNIWVCQKLLDTEFEVERDEDGSGVISVDGIGFPLRQ